jgi:peptidoglycan/xylan/chitin deacetylase (PgdA/CDA1 family)
VADVLGRTGAETRARATHRVMTGDEVCQLAHRPGHSIGAHTVHHLALTTQTLETKRCEVIADKATLEQTIGKPVPLFSYPYGDYDAELVEVVREAGFLAAVTVEAGLVAAGSDRFLLPRYEVTARARGRFKDSIDAIFRTARS